MFLFKLFTCVCVCVCVCVFWHSSEISTTYAYTILTDETRRSIYNQYGSLGLKVSDQMQLQSISIPCCEFQLHFFTSRVVPIWNTMPEHLVSAHNIVTFKSYLKTVDLSPFCKLYPFK